LQQFELGQDWNYGILFSNIVEYWNGKAELWVLVFKGKEISGIMLRWCNGRMVQELSRKFSKLCT